MKSIPYKIFCKHIAKAPRADAPTKTLSKSLQINPIRILKFFSLAPIQEELLKQDKQLENNQINKVSHNDKVLWYRDK